MTSQMTEFLPPNRLLMGAGPANVHPRVLNAMTASLLGHLDPVFLQAMDDVRSMLRDVFMTKNPATLPIPGTGTAGMEAAMVNLLEPGDVILVATNGYFGERLADIASRTGAKVFTIDHEAGEPVSVLAIRDEMAKHARVKAVAVVHAETSTGVLTPIPKISKIVHDAGALLVVDAVTSLGGVELRVDDWDIDVCYSGTQKCIGAPPGLAPITFGQRAVDAMAGRKTKVQSFYLDMTMLSNYWEQRVYHHTAPISMIYSIREALRIVLEEGLENRWARHAKNAEALVAGIDAMGLRVVANKDFRLPSLTAVFAPEGIPEAAVRKDLLENYNIEVSGGLASMPTLAGKIWRIGLMGHNSTATNVLYLLSSLESTLAAHEYEIAVGVGATAAQRVLRG
jgi:alanine-glyoxylate transaminase/serine-glyoxylate transaminase/serine-pyruvate transaminase